MPHLRIETNVPETKIPRDFITKAVPVLASTLGKPTQFCVVSIVPNVSMCFGGSTDPCAIANVMSIGGLGLEQNKKHSKVLYDFIEKELGIPKDRSSQTAESAPTIVCQPADFAHIASHINQKTIPDNRTIEIPLLGGPPTLDVYYISGRAFFKYRI